MNSIIDIAILNSKPWIKKSIIETLDPDGKIQDIITDELLVEMINTFPDIRYEFYKLFVETK